MKNIGIPKLSVQKVFHSQTIATIFVVLLCVQLVAIEGSGVSPIKSYIMGLAPLIFIFKAGYITRAFVWGMLYWAWCLFSAMFNGDMRFSTIGYLGMFVITYIVFYNLVNQGALNLKQFTKLLKYLILGYGIVLVMQQVCVLVGIRNMPLINLVGQGFLSITKLPSLAIEPSHAARLLTVMMLCYVRCLEITNSGQKVSLRTLFSKEHRCVTLLFLWAMLSMGSGTAFIGLGILCLYFIRPQTFFIVIPMLIGIFLLLQTLEVKQFDRALRVTQATLTGDVAEIQDADGSAAARVVPLVNTFKIDLTEKVSWIGNGTTKEDAIKGMIRKDSMIAVVEQYGLIALFISLILVYSCVIYRFFSLETMIFLILFSFSLGNIAYGWGAIMLMTGTRYFQKQYRTGGLL